jgi:G patch domain and KOW motifs-containing protein
MVIGDTSSSGNKLVFSLTKAKTKKAILKVTAIEEFREESIKKEEQPERTTPLIIPLLETSKQSLLERKRAAKAETPDDDNDTASKALIESAARHFDRSLSNKNETSTNFEATGDLVISAGTNDLNNARNKQDTYSDTQQFQNDLIHLPQELDTASESYRKVPIQEFGAALLRGMGWTGESVDRTMVDPVRRPHRLGLGATPKLPPTHKTSNKIRTETQVQRDEHMAQQQKELEAQRSQQIKQDKQLTIQTGSLVHVTGRKRAKMVQLSGVPGLNRVLVQMEGDATTTSVMKGDITMITRSDLESRPYKETYLKVDVEKKSKVEEKEEKRRDGDAMKGSYNDVQINRDDVERRRHVKYEDKGGRLRDEDDRKIRTSDNRFDKRDRKHSRDSDERRKRRDEGTDGRHEKKKLRNDRIDEQYWMIPNIRVRIVTKKLGSSYFTQKGVVIDVTHGGAFATLQMSNGQVLDKVPERYLETALPKSGGNVIVLVGRNKFAKGKLLERDSNLGNGVVQIFDDMNVITLKLDDLAEWCGSLDDDMA